MSQLVKDFSEEIYTQLDSKEKLSIVWEKDITNIQSFGSFFQTLVTEEIQLQVASILQEQLINANVNFSNNKNKEDEKDDISKGSLGGKPLKERTADEKKDSEE